MTSMATTVVLVTGGVDTHGHAHHAAVLDYMGRQLGDREFPTSPGGVSSPAAVDEWAWRS
jgi:transposase